MQTALDCIPCFMRQTLEAARFVTSDHAVQERVIREIMKMVSDMDMDRPPPAAAQIIHRRLREVTQQADPYREAKQRANRMARRFLPELHSWVTAAPDPFDVATRLSVAANVIDLGAYTDVGHEKVRREIDEALEKPLHADLARFRSTVREAESILFIADNAGELALDRLLIEQLGPAKVTVAVRGGPVINDATYEDAAEAALTDLVNVTDTGSDAPGVLLEDCSSVFKRTFTESDVVIAKGQGNFEGLADVSRDVFFLFKVKCAVIAGRSGRPLNSHVLVRGRNGETRSDR